MNWLTDFLERPPMGWWDIADILVVSILIYEMLKLIRGTRAMQMALGGGMVLALFYLPRWSQLETVNFIIRNLVNSLVVAIIVLFQADIRRALAHLGRAPFFRYFTKEESAEESIEELVVAASLLSAPRLASPRKTTRSRSSCPKSRARCRWWSTDRSSAGSGPMSCGRDCDRWSS